MALSFEQIRAAVNKLGNALVSPIKNLLPKSVRFQGRTYRLENAKTPEQFAWYMAVVAMVSPAYFTQVLQSLKGGNYDAEAEFCDACESREIDPATIGIIITIVGAILKFAPDIIKFFQSVAPEPENEIENESSDDSKKDSTPIVPLALLAALLF